MGRSAVILTTLLLLAGVTGCEYQKVLKRGTPEQKLQMAKKYYNKGDYIRAQPLFDDLLAAYRRKPEAEDIYYYYCYCHFGQGDYLMAAYNFKNFVENYPRSSHTEEAAFMSAKCEFLQALPYNLDQSQTRKAIEKIQLFINRYPNSEFVEEGNQLIDSLRERLQRKAYENAILYYDMGYYKSAIVAFKNLIVDYPDVMDKDKIEFLIVKSYYQYAKQSVQSAQEERYLETVTEGNDFLSDNKSKTYRKEVEEMIEKSKEEISRLSKIREENEAAQKRASQNALQSTTDSTAVKSKKK
ncbi:MAG: outer membrane protein assembly factor BamD [Bacteroidetes bacterium]|nr:outer membrane protein assembly factor BamD [Bacteroidota bacterium]